MEFIAVDNPHATRLTLHILAAVAEHERTMISQRTTAALAAAKARGIKLGSPKLAAATKQGNAANAAAADRFAANVAPIIRQIQATGASSLRAVAAALTARAVATARGGAWNPAQVANALRRAALAPPDRGQLEPEGPPSTSAAGATPRRASPRCCGVDPL